MTVKAVDVVPISYSLHSSSRVPPHLCEPAAVELHSPKVRPGDLDVQLKFRSVALYFRVSLSFKALFLCRRLPSGCQHIVAIFQWYSDEYCKRIVSTQFMEWS